jgi:hypothetical protein
MEWRGRPGQGRRRRGRVSASAGRGMVGRQGVLRRGQVWPGKAGMARLVAVRLRLGSDKARQAWFGASRRGVTGLWRIKPRRDEAGKARSLRHDGSRRAKALAGMMGLATSG